MRRRLIFTPEVLASIPEMVERGMHRDEIARVLGTTSGSLAVRCSLLGISLRRGYIVPPRQPKQPKQPKPRQQRGLTLSRSTVFVLHLQAEQRKRDVDTLAKDLLETIARDNLFDAVLDEKESA